LFASCFSCRSFILGLHRPKSQRRCPVFICHRFPLGFLFSPLPDLSFCFGFAAISKIFVCRAFQSWILCRTCFESSARSADLRQGQFSCCAIFVRSFQSPREGSAVFRFSVSQQFRSQGLDLMLARDPRFVSAWFWSGMV
jgi:hypothetical protein